MLAELASVKNLSINGYCDIIAQLGFFLFVSQKIPSDVTNGRPQLTVVGLVAIFEKHRI